VAAFLLSDLASGMTARNHRNWVDCGVLARRRLCRHGNTIGKVCR